MIVHKIRTESEERQPHYRLLMSDTHIGTRSSDHAMIIHDLESARAANARVLLNGDVFDAICPTDKRFDLACLHPDIRGEKDLTNAIVNMAFELLRPYADLFDVIGIGNHEEAWIKYNHSDPVRQLIDLLNREKSVVKPIKHGSFDGWIRTSFDIPNVRKQVLHKLYYYHGTGGDSPVTKGTIDFNRKGRNFSYDCLTFGHKHNLAITVESILDLTSKGNMIQKKQLNLQTASYYQNYSEDDGGHPLDYSYAESKAHAPKPMGGIFLCMRPWLAADGSWFVHQDFMSDYVPAWKPAKVAKAPRLAKGTETLEDAA